MSAFNFMSAWKFVLLLLNLPFYLNFFDAENKIILVKPGKFWLTLSMRNCCTDWKNLADFFWDLAQMSSFDKSVGNFKYIIGSSPIMTLNYKTRN